MIYDTVVVVLMSLEAVQGQEKLKPFRVREFCVSSNAFSSFFFLEFPYIIWKFFCFYSFLLCVCVCVHFIIAVKEVRDSKR